MTWWLRIPGLRIRPELRSYGTPTPEVGRLVVINPGLDDALVEKTIRAFDRLATIVPRMNSTVDREEIELLAGSTTVMWYRGPVAHHQWLKFESGRWTVRLQWKGSIAESELYHALLHLVNHAIRLPKVRAEDRDRFVVHDVEHLEPEWWMMCGHLIDDL